MSPTQAKRGLSGPPELRSNELHLPASTTAGCSFKSASLNPVGARGSVEFEEGERRTAESLDCAWDDKVGASYSLDGCHMFPGFPVEPGSVGKLHAVFLNENRTRGCVRSCGTGNPVAPASLPQMSSMSCGCNRWPTTSQFPVYADGYSRWGRLWSPDDKQLLYDRRSSARASISAYFGPVRPPGGISHGCPSARPLRLVSGWQVVVRSRPGRRRGCLDQPIPSILEAETAPRRIAWLPSHQGVSAPHIQRRSLGRLRRRHEHTESLNPHSMWFPRPVPRRNASLTDGIGTTNPAGLRICEPSTSSPSQPGSLIFGGFTSTRQRVRL